MKIREQVFFIKFITYKFMFKILDIKCVVFAILFLFLQVQKCPFDTPILWVWGAGDGLSSSMELSNTLLEIFRKLTAKFTVILHWESPLNNIEKRNYFYLNSNFHCNLFVKFTGNLNLLLTLSYNNKPGNQYYSLSKVLIIFLERKRM